MKLKINKVLNPFNTSCSKLLLFEGLSTLSARVPKSQKLKIVG